MASGGMRLRSGPTPSPTSARSDKRGYRLKALPAEGYSGPVPDFPLPNPSAREADVWAELWRLPQACVWSRRSELWRLGTIALYVRQRVKCEAPDIGASHIAQIHRFADQIGLTDAGLAAMGYAIEAEDVPSPAPTKAGSSRERLRAVHPLERARIRAEGGDARAVIEGTQEAPR